MTNFNVPYAPPWSAGYDYFQRCRKPKEPQIHKTPIIRAVEHHEQVIKPKIKEIERMIKYKSPQEAAMLGFRLPKEAVKSDNVSLMKGISNALGKFVKNIAKNPLKLLKFIR